MTDAQVSAGHRQVSFGEAVQLFFSNYVNFTGRSSRGAYWWWVLAALLINIVLSIIDVGILGMAEFQPFSNLFALATLIPGIALGVRRLHDVGRTGWWLLIALTVIGILLLLFWFVQPGQRSENAFGPDVEAGKA